MADIFDAIDGKHSTFFVGGRGVGIAQPGGCTKAWWDTKVASVGEAAALAALMTATGGAIDTMSFASGGDSGSGFIRITAAGEFSNTEVGMVAYCDFLFGNYPDSYYEIIGVDSGGDWIDINLIWTMDDDFGGVTVGGAFDDFQTCLDEMDASVQFVTMFDNLGDSNRTSSIDIQFGGGETPGTQLRLVGYGTLPSDGQKVVYNFNGNIPLPFGSGMYIWPQSADMYNLIIENYHVTGAGDGSGWHGNGIVRSASYDVNGIAFFNCDFSNTDPLKVANKGINFRWYYDYSSSSIIGLMVGCNFYDGTTDAVTQTSVANIQYGHLCYVNCKSYDNGPSGIGVGMAFRGSSAFNCASYNNGLYGAATMNQGGFLVNCILAGNGSYGFYKSGTINHGYMVDCIISDNTTGAINQGTDGSLTTYNTTLIGLIPTTIDTHRSDNLTNDPRLANVVNGDLRILNSWLKFSGIDDIHGNPGQHGPPTAIAFTKKRRSRY